MSRHKQSRGRDYNVLAVSKQANGKVYGYNDLSENIDMARVIAWLELAPSETIRQLADYLNAKNPATIENIMLSFHSPKHPRLVKNRSQHETISYSTPPDPFRNASKKQGGNCE